MALILVVNGPLHGLMLWLTGELYHSGRIHF